MGVGTAVLVRALDLCRLRLLGHHIGASRANNELARVWCLVIDQIAQLAIQCLTVLLFHINHSGMPLIHFDSIFEQAAQRKGGEAALRDLLPQPKSTAALRRVSDAACLEEMTKCIFRAGFVWRVIDNKWEGFQRAFDDFDVTGCSLLGDEDLERLAQDASIVRNASKIATVPKNAQFVLDIRAEHGSFARYLAGWPVTDFVGLWADLKARGNRLGGQTGRYFLRFVGYDSPLLSPDVVRALIAASVIDKEPTSKKGLAATQAAFVAWHEQTQLPMSGISRVLACSQPQE